MGPKFVPTFGSFRIKDPAGSAEPVDDEAKAKAGGHGKKEKHRDKSHRHHERRHRVRDDIEHGELSSRLDQALGKNRDLEVESPQDHSELYVVDGKGDQDNVRYGTNKSSSVPLHREPRVHTLLGNHRRLNSPRSGPSNLLRNLTIEERRKLLAKGKRLVIPEEADDPTNGDLDKANTRHADFLALRPRKRRKLLISTQPLGAERPIEDQQGRTTSQVEDDQSDQSDSDANSRESDDEIDLNDGSQSLQRQRARLAASTKADPGNVQNWIDFISFQDEWILQGQNKEDVYEIIDSRPAAEVKLSIYKDALRSTDLVAAEGREQLLMGMLAEAEKVYTVDRLTSLWRDTIKKHSDHLDLFLKYVEFMQTNAAEFNFKECRSLFLEYIDKIKRLALKSLSAPQKIELYQRHVHALLRATNFFRDSGYRELAIAIWQALLERNLMSGNSLVGDSSEEDDTAFQEFWDSEAPRIGEVDGNGWRIEAQNPLVLPVSTQGNDLRPSTVQTDDGLQDWAREESYQQKVRLLPNRTTDEDDYSSDDPFRIAFFDDIQPFIATYKDTLFYEILINGFLCFMHLPPPTVSDEEIKCNVWWDDGFLITAQEPPQSCHSSTASLFDVRDSAFEMSKNDQRMSQFCSRALATLLTSPLISNSTEFYVGLAEYHIAHLVQAFPASPKIALKRAQIFLKARPSSLRLYNAYALAASRSDVQKSDHVFATAITNATILDTEEQIHVPLLYLGWVWSAISAKNRELALQRLATYSDNRAVSVAGLDQELDRVHQQLLEAIFKSNTFIDKRTRIGAGHTLVLLTLLVYVRTSYSLTAALDTYAEHLARLHDISSLSRTVLENIHEARARLIRHHTSTTPATSPRTIRDALEGSVRLFPANMLIRRVWRDNERRFLFDEHVRRLAKQARSLKTTLHAGSDVENGILSALNDIEDALSRLGLSSTVNAHTNSSQQQPRPSTDLSSRDLASQHIQSQATSSKTRTESPSKDMLYPDTADAVHANAASINTALSQYTRTLSHPSHRKSPAVWLSYLSFLSQLVGLASSVEQITSIHNTKDSQKDTQKKDSTKNIQKERHKESQKAEKATSLRSAFYTALDAVPYSKAIAMRAFTDDNLAAVLTEGEKRRVLDVMEERGLRMFVLT